tara:strand:+ start:2161 stop:3723 length:1563 start_codon:yes stop_codon:yes gene_type:complete
MNIIKYIIENKFIFIIGLLNGIISSVFLSYVPYYHSKILINLEKEEIYEILKLYIFYKIIGNIFAGIRGSIFTYVIGIITKKLKKDILEKFLYQSMLYYDNNERKDIANILLDDAEKVAVFYSLNMNVLIRNFARFIITMYIMCKYSIWYFIYVCLCCYLQIYTNNIYNKQYYEKTCKRNNEIQREISHIIHDYIFKVLTYRTLGIEYIVYKKWEEKQNLLSKNKILETRDYGINLCITQSLNSIIIVLVILMGKRLMNENIYTFVIYTDSIISIMNELREVNNHIENNKKNVENVKELMKKEDEINDGILRPDINKIDIIIENLSFYYEENKIILQHLNYNINEGDIIGISGASGKGKSTLLKLILGLYKPIEGSIKIGGYDLNSLNKEWLYRDLIGYVGQDYVLINGTTEDNLLLGRYEKDEWYYKVRKILGDDIPEDIGENTDKLSNGQKQRISIGRILIKRPKIMLFDEFSSALDIENEQRILNSIIEFNKEYKPIIIIITHKLSTLKICEKVIKL